MRSLHKLHRKSFNEPDLLGGARTYISPFSRFGSSIILIMLFALPNHRVLAQKSRGDKCFKAYEYHDAIKYYKNAYSSNPSDTASLVRLAECYQIIRDYDNAELYYSKAALLPGIGAQVYFNYGEILKNNGKIDEAHNQFLKATILEPSDSNAAREVRYCNKLKQKFYIDYPVKIVPRVNSDLSDFAPIIYQDSLVFISDRSGDMINLMHNNITGGNFYKIYVARSTADGFGKPELFPIPDNKTLTECSLGPISFSADGKEMFYTEVKSIRKSNFVNQAKIYYCEKTGNNWGTPKAFPYNSDSYSVMDPVLSADGRTLYFSSDMPGGYGGCDIYACQRMEGGNWSQPKNLGNEVNTPGNEVFPYIRNDGVLFFSSDRHFNFGGLDIFSSTTVKGKWTNVENLGPEVNSSTDDFAICFNNNNRTGYFTSNRKGGVGHDDIYSFFYIGDYRPLKGKVLFSADTNDPASNLGVKLLNDSGTVLASENTDSKGKFRFEKLEPDKKYFVQVNQDDPRFAGKKKFYLADSSGRIVAVSLRNGTMGKYVFSMLPPDLTTLPKISTLDNNINISGNLLAGDSSKPMSGAKVSLLNGNGQVVQTATTNAFGSFVFTNLPTDNNYKLKVDMTGDTKFNGKTKIVLTDKNGNTLQTVYPGADGNFQFEILASDTTTLQKMSVDDPQLRLELRDILLSDQKKPLSDVKVNVTDDQGNIIQTATTGANGSFTFTNLPEDKANMLQVDMNDPRLAKMKMLYIADSHNNILNELLPGKGGFRYRMLPADKRKMGDIYVYDPWIVALNLKNTAKAKDSIDIIENIYYDYQKWDILPAAARVLDKVVKVMKTNPGIKIELYAYTDPRGSDQFNLELSQKRADAAVDYIIAHGIDRKRVTGKGLGKSHLLNDCGNPNVHCTEEQFAINRRTEFKIIKSGK